MAVAAWLGVPQMGRATHILRVTTVSVRTVEITTAMEKAAR